MFGVEGERPMNHVVRQETCNSLRLRNSAMHLAIETRGGAVPPEKKKKGTTKTTKKKKKSSKESGKKGSSTKSKKKGSVYPYDDDDDFMNDGKRRQELSYYKPRAKSGPTVWQRATVMAKAAAEKAVEKSKVAADKAKEFGVEAAQRAQKAQRLAKAYYSSEYEKFLLTATWPSDQGIPPQLTKRLVESVARFPTRPASLPEDDPYRVTLRKLWKKMVEQDWRTSMKALYLLHALSRQSPVPKARALSRTLKAMLTDLDPKSGRKYFNRRDLVVKKAQEERARLVDAYAGLVLRRTLLFAGADFQDVSKSLEIIPQDGILTTAAAVKLTSRRAQHALLVLEHAVQFIEIARIGPDGKPIKPSNAHLVVISCLDLVLQDLAGAFKLAATSVATLATLASITDSDIALSSSATSDVQKCLEKFNSLRPRLTKAAKAAVKSLRYFDNKVNTEFLSTDSVLDEETTQTAIEAWANRPATAPDDDDEDLDDDDDTNDDDDDDDDHFDDDDDDDDFDDDDF